MGYGHRRRRSRRPWQMGAIDECYDDPAAAVRGADLVILCTPVGVFPEMLQSIGPALGARRDRHRRRQHQGERGRGPQRKLLPKTAHFVGSHPDGRQREAGGGVRPGGPVAAARCASSRPTNPPTRMRWRRSNRSGGCWACGRPASRRPSTTGGSRTSVTCLTRSPRRWSRCRTDASFDLAGKGFADTTRIAARRRGAVARHLPRQPGQPARRHRAVPRRSWIVSPRGCGTATRTR